LSCLLFFFAKPTISFMVTDILVKEVKMTEKGKEAYKQLVRSQLYLSLDVGIRLAMLQDIINYRVALEEDAMTERLKIRYEHALEIIKICDQMSDKEERLLGNQ